MVPQIYCRGKVLSKQKDSNLHQNVIQRLSRGRQIMFKFLLLLWHYFFFVSICVLMYLQAFASLAYAMNGDGELVSVDKIQHLNYGSFNRLS